MSSDELICEGLVELDPQEDEDEVEELRATVPLAAPEASAETIG